MRIRTGGLLVAAALALDAAGAPAAQTPAAVIPDNATLAIVRADGTLIPFAAWTGERFENRWPSPSRGVDVPITLADVPKRWWRKSQPVLRWYAFLGDGSRAEIVTGQPTWYLAHCQQGVGLRSSLQTAPRLPPPIVQPYPKAGVAASVRLPFQPIGVMDPASPQAKALADAIAGGVEQEEASLAARYLAAGWRHPADEAVRRSTPLRVEALYRSSLGNGRFAYYFEAAKRYRDGAADRPEDAARRDRPDCDTLTFVSGWFVAGNTFTTVPRQELSVRMTSCDYADADVMLPLAYLQDEGRPLWIVQLSGWGRERYALLRFAEDAEPVPEALLATAAGECPRI